MAGTITRDSWVWVQPKCPIRFKDSIQVWRVRLERVFELDFWCKVSLRKSQHSKFNQSNFMPQANDLNDWEYLELKLSFLDGNERLPRKTRNSQRTICQSHNFKPTYSTSLTSFWHKQSFNLCSLKQFKVTLV